MNNGAKDKVILGLSGGVDSTSAALLLKENGYQVYGVYFSVFKEKGKEYYAAERAAQQLKIPFIYRNVAEEFELQIMNPFCEEYQKGRTPNPCTLCNPNVKFKVLIEEANKQGAYYIATGHYANIHYEKTLDHWFIKRGINNKKDQSYMLYGLDEDVIKRLLLPLGNWEDKEKVRKIALANKLDNAEKKDSQEICFIEKDYSSFLRQKGYIAPPGNFLDVEGKIVGKHQGISNYTIGQRKGLGIALGRPVFVLSIDPEKNIVVLGEEEYLMKKKVYSKDYKIQLSRELMMSLPLSGKIRYGSQPAPGKVSFDENDILCFTFEEKQRAITPGQSLVLYYEGILLGGGIID